MNDETDTVNTEGEYADGIDRGGPAVCTGHGRYAARARIGDRARRTPVAPAPAAKPEPKTAEVVDLDARSGQSKRAARARRKPGSSPISARWPACPNAPPRCSPRGFRPTRFGASC